MKKYLVILFVFTLFGCSTLNNLFDFEKNAPKEKFSVEKNVILYEGKPFAELQAMTWSLDGGELIREMNFKLLNKHDLSVIGGMIDYLSDRHQGDEIEVEFEIPHNNEQFIL